MKRALEDLARLPGVWLGGELEHVVREVVATGHAELDRELPGGGWPLGSLSEVLHDEAGIGEVGFLCGALARASEGRRRIAWVSPPHLPYAPALVQHGLALDRCLVVRPVHREDALWAAEQSLRSGACGAVLLWLPNAPAEGGEYACLRRLHMAAQAGRSMAVLFRSSAAESRSTPAHLRVALTRRADALELRIPKRRGPPLVEPIALVAGWRSRTAPEARAAACVPSRVPVPADPPRALPRIAA